MKKITSLLFIIILFLFLVSCKEDNSETLNDSRFIIINSAESPIGSQLTIRTSTREYTVYDKYTHVMYIYTLGYHDNVSVTPLYNADGSLMIYEGDIE